MSSSLYTPTFADRAHFADESERPQLWQGLVGLWCPPLGISGEKLFDVSGRQNHGVLTNMDVSTDWVMSPYGWALDFSVSAMKYVRILGTPALPGDLTIAFWIKPLSVTDNQYISDFSGINEFACILGYQNGYYNVFGGNYPTGNATDSRIPASGVGVWDLVVWTKRGSNLKGYVNGVEHISVTITKSGFTPSSGLVLGTYYIGLVKLNAQLGTVYLYSRALTLAEIADLYADPFAMLRRRRPMVSRIPAVGGPYRVEAGEVFHAGAVAGEVFHTGAVAGQIV